MTQNVHDNSPDFGTTEGLRAFGERLTAEHDGLRLLAVRHVDDGYALVLETTADGLWHQVDIAEGEMMDVNGATPEHDTLVKRLLADAFSDSSVIDRHETTSVPLEQPATAAQSQVVVKNTPVVEDADKRAVDEEDVFPPPAKNLPKMAKSKG